MNTMQSLPSRAHSGGALLLALIVVLVASLVTASLLRLSSTVSSRQAQGIDDLRAFYIAEAGLSEAYEAVRVGKRGQIASIEAPARFGDGLVWVDAMPTPNGALRLESTAICGRGRSTLAVIVEPVETPLGIFSAEDLLIETALLVDSFESDPAGSGSVFVDPANADLHADGELLFYQGVFYRYQENDGTRYDYDQRVTVHELSQSTAHGSSSPYAIDAEDFVGEKAAGHYAGSEYTGVLDYFARALAAESLTPPSGLLGSNGSVTIDAGGEPVVIQGDVVPGMGGEVLLGQGASVTGSTAPRSHEVALTAVEVPPIELAEALVHDDAFPLILSPGTHGLEGIDVAPDAELILRGPATIVLGSLSLAPGADLLLDTTDGPVELFITESLDLAPGSLVTTTSQQTQNMSLRVSASEPGLDGPAVQLEAESSFYGTIYAPEAEVVVGSEFELFGSIAASVLNFRPGAQVHYDVGLEDEAPKVVSWKYLEVPADLVPALQGFLDAAGLEADRPALHEAHDLGGISVDLAYIDPAGTEVTYEGPEEAFDWDSARALVQAERSGRENWGTGRHNRWWQESGDEWWIGYEDDWFDSWGGNWGEKVKKGKKKKKGKGKGGGKGGGGPKGP